MGRDSPVGIATSYYLDNTVTESRWGRDFPRLPNRPWTGLAPYTMGTGSFPGVKRPGRGVDHTPHLAPRLKKEFSYTSILLWASMECRRVTFTFNFTFKNLGLKLDKMDFMLLTKALLECEHLHNSMFKSYVTRIRNLQSQ